jgi:hypothetical protein
MRFCPGEVMSSEVLSVEVISSEVISSEVLSSLRFVRDRRIHVWIGSVLSYVVGS